MSVSLVLGLVTFADQAIVKHELTPLFESFRVGLDRVSAQGDTAAYDALDLARSRLTQFRQDLPGLRRRIIIVSDGDDTNSRNMPTNVCAALQRDGIIVDSVQVGHIHNRILHAISVATGGYRFSPRTSLGDALSIFDLETMLFSGERPTTSMKDKISPVTSTWQLQQYGNSLVYPIDAITIDQFPQRAEHPRLREAARDVSKSVVVSPSTSERMRRIMRELQDLAHNPHPHIDAYVNDADMSFLKVIIEAPSDVDQCPYKGGSFLLTCDLPAQYPRDPPEVRFVTFILHPNVSKQGKVCVAELGRLWTSDITLKEILALVYGLLLEPDLENPLEIQASLKYYDDDGTYALAAAKAVNEHASKTRDEWRRELET
jgi:ubiquitin-protein ligase